jgi:hypothetical protein
MWNDVFWKMPKGVSNYVKNSICSFTSSLFFPAKNVEYLMEKWVDEERKKVKGKAIFGIS